MSAACEANKSKVNYVEDLPDLNIMPIIHKFIKGCLLCHALYTDDNKPYQISCGHSLCSKCREKLDQNLFYCHKCTKKIPQFSGAIENKCLLEQIIRVNNDEDLSKKIEENEKLAETDPLIKLQTILYDKLRQVTFLRFFYSGVYEQFQEYNKYGEIVENYPELVKEFSEKQMTCGVSTSLSKLKEKISTSEEILKLVTNYDNLQNLLNSSKEFLFNYVKEIEIQYNYKTVCDFFTIGYDVNAFMKRKDGNIVGARCTNQKLGFHIHSCQPKLDEHQVYFWCGNIWDDMNIRVATHLFMNSEGINADGSNLNRRIYISIRADVFKQELFDYFIGVEEQLEEFNLDLKDGLRAANLPNSFNLIKDGDYPQASDEEGLVCLRVHNDNSVTLIITLDANPGAKMAMAIGKVVTGIKYLRLFEAIVVSGFGFCVQIPPSD